MHEFALYGQVSKTDHPRVLQQLAGVTRMQPLSVQEIHLVFKAVVPQGLSKIPSAGGSQGVMQQEIQRVKNMLNSSLYYIQLVGEIIQESGNDAVHNGADDIVMSDGESHSTRDQQKITWHLDFRDIPDAGKQTVSTRLISRLRLEDGNLTEFLQHFGYEYVSRYVITGNKFYDQDATIFLHKILQVPQTSTKAADFTIELPLKMDDMQELDSSGGYTMQVSVDAVDGNNPELKDRAIRQLLSLKETLKQAVQLLPGDRLALDSRLPAVLRRN